MGQDPDLRSIVTEKGDEVIELPAGGWRCDGQARLRARVSKVRELSMDVGTQSDQPVRDPEAEVLAYLKDRSVPCPRCAYDLRDIQSAKCPECGEPLVLKIGSPRARFGWLVLAMAPGCFSGVASLFVLIPIGVTIWHRLPPGQGMPWPGMVADAFGFVSAGSVWLMYRHRHRIMAWRTKRQAAFAIGVWGVHILAFFLVVLGMWWVH